MKSTTHSDSYFESDEFKIIDEKVSQEANILLKDVPKGLGFCYIYWNCKKEIFKNKYEIDWITPAEKFPNIKFD